MILKFRHKGLDLLFSSGKVGGVPPHYARRLQLILAQLAAAHRPENMDSPGLRFHALKGDRRGQYAVWVSGNWRLVFEFEGEHATNVDLVDYH